MQSGVGYGFSTLASTMAKLVQQLMVGNPQSPQAENEDEKDGFVFIE
jgi:hypothetical protein